MKKYVIMIAAFMAVILIAGLCISASDPHISCKYDISEEYLEAIKAQARGLYSDILWLVPVFVTVDSVLSDRVYYTVYYFPFGTLGMSYSGTDGYNNEKPLTGI